MIGCVRVDLAKDGQGVLSQPAADANCKGRCKKDRIKF